MKSVSVQENLFREIYRRIGRIEATSGWNPKSQKQDLGHPILSLRAAEVGAFAGVYADLLTFVDEGGNLNHEAGLGLGRLGDAGSRGGLQAWLGFDDFEFDC